MEDQPKFHAVGGQLHRVIYEPVDQDSVDAEIAAQLDSSQTALNFATQARIEAEGSYAIAEAAAEQASLILDAARASEGDAESAFQKSVATRDSLVNAKQLAIEQSEQADAEESDSESDEDDDEEDATAGAVNVPITAAS